MKTEPIKLETFGGNHIDDVSKEAAALAINKKCRVEFDFNDITVTVEPGDSWKKVRKQWSDKDDARREAYRNSPAGIEAARRQAAAAEAQAAREKKNPFVPEAQMRDEKVPWPKTIEELGAYIGTLTDRPHDYGTCAYATSMAATAAFQYVAGLLGITGFQASCADMDILKRTRGLNSPFIILKAEDLLFPQYDLREKLEEFIAKSLPWAKEQATKNLAEKDQVHPDVKARWEQLAAA